MSKKGLTALAVLLVSGGIAVSGCSNQGQSKKDTSGKKTMTTAVSKKKSQKTKTSTEKTSTLWDKDKDTHLESFMDQWGPTMKQEYSKYNGTDSLKTSTDIVYPDDLSKVTVEGSNSSIGWSKDGSNKYTYNVVAIYNYNGIVPPLPNHITYFFAFHNGEPIVLVDQSRDGQPNLTETANTKLKSGFDDVVAGKVATIDSDTGNSQASTDNKKTTELTSDPKLVGVMVHQLALPGDDLSKEDMLSIYLDNGKYEIGIGTATSTIGYAINGEVVNYYTRDYSHGDSTATAPLIEHSISLNDLESTYYSTDAQKQLVQSVANKMPAIQQD